MRIIFCLFVCMFQIGLLAQEDQVHLWGKVYTERTNGVRDFFRDVEIEITKNDQLVVQMVSDSIGGFEFYADLDGIWTFKVNKKGFYTKWVEIDMSHISEEEKEGGFLMTMDFTMEKNQNLRTKRLLKSNPIGKCAFDPLLNALSWDEEYTTNIKSQMKK